MTRALLGEGAFDGLLWQNTWETENETYIAFHNGTALPAEMKAAASGEVAELLYGSTEGSFAAGELSATLPPSCTVVFRMLPARKTGLYAGNILYTDRRPCPVTFENYDGSMAALYDGKELIRLCMGGEKLDGEGKIKIFKWTDMQPGGAVQEVAYAD